MSNTTDKKVKKVTKMFVEDLRRIRGGKTDNVMPGPCPEITTLACGEERPWFCNGC